MQPRAHWLLATHAVPESTVEMPPPRERRRRVIKVRGSSTAWVRGVAALLALMTVLTFSAPPCDASETPQATPKASEKRSLSASAAAHVAAMAPSPRALAQDPTVAATTGESRSFFRTPTGVAAIVLMVAGASYVAYKIPKDNGKVHSPIR